MITYTQYVETLLKNVEGYKFKNKEVTVATLPNIIEELDALFYIQHISRDSIQFFNKEELSKDLELYNNRIDYEIEVEDFTNEILTDTDGKLQEQLILGDDFEIEVEDMVVHEESTEIAEELLLLESTDVVETVLKNDNEVGFNTSEGIKTVEDFINEREPLHLGVLYGYEYPTYTDVENSEAYNWTDIVDLLSRGITVNIEDDLIQIEDTEGVIEEDWIERELEQIDTEAISLEEDTEEEEDIEDLLEDDILDTTEEDIEDTEEASYVDENGFTITKEFLDTLIEDEDYYLEDEVVFFTDEYRNKQIKYIDKDGVEYTLYQLEVDGMEVGFDYEVTKEGVITFLEDYAEEEEEESDEIIEYMTEDGAVITSKELENLKEGVDYEIDEDETIIFLDAGNEVENHQEEDDIPFKKPTKDFSDSTEGLGLFDGLTGDNEGLGDVTNSFNSLLDSVYTGLEKTEKLLNEEENKIPKTSNESATNHFSNNLNTDFNTTLNSVPFGGILHRNGYGTSGNPISSKQRHPSYEANNKFASILKGVGQKLVFNSKEVGTKVTNYFIADEN